jgi:hypothetical protein
LQNVKVVIGVSPRSLLRAVEHLLGSEKSLQIVSRSTRKSHLLAHSCGLSPEVIVVNTHLLGRQVAESIAQIRRRSPGSWVILAFPFKEFSRTVGNCGADGGLSEEDLVFGLPRMIRRLSRKRSLCADS